MSLAYKKMIQSICEAANNLGFMIRKFDFVPRRIINQLLLEGGRRADSKLIETTLGELNNKQDWAFTGIEHETENSIQQAAIVYDYLEKSYKFVHGDGSITNCGAWENALYEAHRYFKDSDKVYLLDSHRRVRLSNTTKANILLSRR